ncbi:hypothetical protein MKY37_00060 [Psychrobacillus sp. FSL K6-2836]|uniref:hypothetical protein n=1 Tax=Psychrobacillus sp. FSL K6-2836 TaxID=2921548 RepID=UPI0030F68D92
MFGCSKTEESKESNWEDLLSSNPKLETNQEEIPEDILRKIKIPKYSTIPFELNQVQITPLQTSVSVKGPLLIDIIFKGKKDILHVTNLFVKENPTLATQETVELNNGIEAHWDGQGDGKILSWHDSKENLVIDLMIPSLMGEGNDYTIKDFLKMANSIE